MGRCCRRLGQPITPLSNRTRGRLAKGDAHLGFGFTTQMGTTVALVVRVRRWEGWKWWAREFLRNDSFGGGGILAVGPHYILPPRVTQSSSSHSTNREDAGRSPNKMRQAFYEFIGHLHSFCIGNKQEGKVEHGREVARFALRQSLFRARLFAACLSIIRYHLV